MYTGYNCEFIDPTINFLSSSLLQMSSNYVLQQIMTKRNINISITFPVSSVSTLSLSVSLLSVFESDV